MVKYFHSPSFVTLHPFQQVDSLVPECVHLSSHLVEHRNHQSTGSYYPNQHLGQQPCLTCCLTMMRRWTSTYAACSAVRALIRLASTVCRDRLSSSSRRDTASSWSICRRSAHTRPSGPTHSADRQSVRSGLSADPEANRPF